MEVSLMERDSVMETKWKEGECLMAPPGGEVGELKGGQAG